MLYKKSVLGLFVLVALMLLAVIACGGDGELDESLTSLEVGDCIDSTDESSLSEEIEEVESIDCDSDGAIEVVEVFNIEGYGDDFPGGDVIDEEVASGCPDEVALTLYPTEDSWERVDDREVVCFAFPDDESGIVGGPEDTGDDDDGGDDGGDDDGGSFNVCDLLSADDVADALGSEMTSDGDEETCDWDAEDDLTSKFLTVDVILDDEEEARDVLEATASVFGDDAVEEVEGIGDEAIISEEIGLEVLQDDDYLRVDIYGSDFDREELEIERELAEKILPQLP